MCGAPCQIASCTLWRSSCHGLRTTWIAIPASTLRRRAKRDFWAWNRHGFRFKKATTWGIQESIHLHLGSFWTTHVPFLSFLSIPSVEKICQAIEAPEMGVAWDYSAFIVHMATAFLVTAVVSASVCRDSMAGCEDSSWMSWYLCAYHIEKIEPCCSDRWGGNSFWHWPAGACVPFWNSRWGDVFMTHSSDSINLW